MRFMHSIAEYAHRFHLRNKMNVRFVSFELLSIDFSKSVEQEEAARISTIYSNTESKSDIHSTYTLIKQRDTMSIHSQSIRALDYCSAMAGRIFYYRRAASNPSSFCLITAPLPSGHCSVLLPIHNETYHRYSQRPLFVSVFDRRLLQY